MWALGEWLSPAIARPWPSPEMVWMFRPLSGFSFPSLFALRYAATFGFLAVLATMRGSGVLPRALWTVCGAFLKFYSWLDCPERLGRALAKRGDHLLLS